MKDNSENGVPLVVFLGLLLGVVLLSVVVVGMGFIINLIVK